MLFKGAGCAGWVGGGSFGCSSVATVVCGFDRAGASFLGPCALVSCDGVGAGGTLTFAGRLPQPARKKLANNHDAHNSQRSFRELKIRCFEAVTRRPLWGEVVLNAISPITLKSQENEPLSAQGTATGTETGSLQAAWATRKLCTIRQCPSLAGDSSQ